MNVVRSAVVRGAHAANGVVHGVASVAANGAVPQVIVTEIMIGHVSVIVIGVMIRIVRMQTAEAPMAKRKDGVHRTKADVPNWWVVSAAVPKVKTATDVAVMVDVGVWGVIATQPWVAVVIAINNAANTTIAVVVMATDMVPAATTNAVT